ncbi:hypothetical protein BKA70DRAFT_1438144 [Coprinopsis sp. MPI-PUGE-AT-0042]|nr:hypothetical protein BKA70DRAFT_1438144 [Coprinopsis sp. MPI-PUGE-AT-0042]
MSPAELLDPSRDVKEIYQCITDHAMLCILLPVLWLNMICGIPQCKAISTCF